jgi:spore maturation protein CgeB
MRKALPGYDACMVVRPFNVPEFERLGAKNVVHVFRSYDEVMHAPPPSGPVPAQFDNDVVFIGRNFDGEGRDDLMLHLIDQGIKPAIWGDNWQASPQWAKLRPYWKGSSISGRDYVNAMHHARICLGLLSSGNRDEHTTRSMEIPYAGGLFCAQRTPEHMQLYSENSEAVFWSDPEECAALCKRLLAKPDEVVRIKQAGRERVLKNKVGNEDLCRTAIKALGLEGLT